MWRALRRDTRSILSLLASRLQAAVLPPTTPSFCCSSISAATTTLSVFDPELLRYLVCPLTKGALRYDADAQQLISEEISVAYPIVNGIPRLVPTAGHVIDTAEVAPSE